MTEETKYPRKQSAKLTTVRNLTRNTKGPVRIMCIVVEAQSGVALVQDIFDEVGMARSIKAIVEGTLTVAEKYILIGEITEKSTDDGKELQLVVSLANNINEFDINLYKQTMEMEERIIQALNR